MAMFGKNWLEDEPDDGPMVPSSWKEVAEEAKNSDKRIGPLSNLNEEETFDGLFSKWKNKRKNKK